MSLKKTITTSRFEASILTDYVPVSIGPRELKLRLASLSLVNFEGNSHRNAKLPT